MGNHTHLDWLRAPVPTARESGLEQRPRRAPLCLNFDTLHQYGGSSGYPGLNEQPAGGSFCVPNLPRAPRTQIGDFSKKKLRMRLKQLNSHPSGSTAMLRAWAQSQRPAGRSDAENETRSRAANSVHEFIDHYTIISHCVDRRVRIQSERNKS
ncbi:hypothetical protein BJV78DRAFT_197595 [Lactifluus subvellereus]|nr:hypothetical protein BJV78DRAFT_197595 [Lactifluus subvellereus]